MNYILDNAFRVLGLPVNATGREIASRYDELLAYGLTGTFPTFDQDFPCLGRLDRSEETVRIAYQELQNPTSKVRHTLFWFWLQHDVDGVALACLRIGRKEEALKLWNLLVSERKHTWSTVNNISVLLMAMLLEELRVRPEVLPQRIEACFSWWAMRATEDDAWKEIRRLVHEYVPSEGYEIEQKHILRAIHILLRPHLSADGVMSHYLTVLSQSKFDAVVKDEIREEIIGSPANKIRSSIQECAQARAVDSTDSYDRGCRLLEQAQEPLRVLSRWLGSDDDTVSRLSNDVAAEVCACAIAYGNKTDDFVRAKDLLVRAHPLITDPDFKNRTDENISTYTKNIAYKETFETCWFCRASPVSESTAHSFSMYRIVERTFSGVRYQTLTARVPRCTACRSKHWITESGLFAIPITAGIIGIVISEGTGWILGLIAGAIAYFGCRFIEPRSKMTHFPPVQELMAEGWEVGKKPSQYD